MLKFSKNQRGQNKNYTEEDSCRYMIKPQRMGKKQIE